MIGTEEAKVAVVLTCCNEGAYVGPAIRSVLDQTRSDCIESIVIADDGSGADTIAVLQEIERWDSRIRVLYGAGGAGLPAQRNLAIEHTRAPLIAILDGDDLWAPDKLERQLPALNKGPNVGLVYSGYSTFGAEGPRYARRARVRDITATRDLAETYFLNDPPIIPSTTILRRSAFEACGRFDPTVRVFEDSDLYLRLSRVCRFAFVDANLLYKRVRSNSITGARKDLMAYHALVALRAAADDPRLLPLVPRRLAERARKLGNQSFLLGDVAGARRLLRFATRLHVTNLRAWASLIVASCFARPATYLIKAHWRSRRVVLSEAGS